MNSQDDRRLRQLLREAIPPYSERDLESDLWPRMLRRLDSRPAPRPWFDLALAALAALSLILFPGAIPGLLYHL
jgi:hypothetical protein